MYAAFCQVAEILSPSCLARAWAQHYLGSGCGPPPCSIHHQCNSSQIDDKASRKHAKGLTGMRHALQGMMQVHQGMQYGGPSPSMYQPQQQYVPIPQHQQNEQLRQFWLQQHREIQEVGTDPAEFKNHQLPLARIKKASLALAHQLCPHTCTL